MCKETESHEDLEDYERDLMYAGPVLSQGGGLELALEGDTGSKQ